MKENIEKVIWNKNAPWILYALMILFLVLAIASAQGCVSAGSSSVPASPPSVLKSSPPSVSENEFNMNAVATKGNHSYVPLHIQGTPDEYRGLILNVIWAFEQAHPELEVTDWKIEKIHWNLYNRYIDGLWIDHKPRGL